MLATTRYILALAGRRGVLTQCCRTVLFRTSSASSSGVAPRLDQETMSVEEMVVAIEVCTVCMLRV